MLELAEDTLLRFGGDADSGIAHQKADFVGPDARLDNQRHAAALSELDRVAGQVQQHLAQPRRVSHDFHRQPLVDKGGDFELPRLRAWRQELGDVLDQCGKREWTVLKVDLSSLNLGIIQQFLDQRHQRVA